MTSDGVLYIKNNDKEEEDLLQLSCSFNLVLFSLNNGKGSF